MQDPLSRTFSALADPTRRAILARLRNGDATVNQIAAPFLGQMTLPGVTISQKKLIPAHGTSANRHPIKMPKRN